jgi:biotin transport system substrate-specific component
MPSSIRTRLWPAAAERSRAATLTLAVALAVLTAVAAQIRLPLPFTPIPVTFQVLTVLAAGFLLSPAAAAASMGIYLGMGAAGAPVFSGGVASSALGGLTAGYLLSYPAAAALVSVLARRRQGLGRRLLAGAAGLALVHLCGAAWLALAVPGSPAATGGLLTWSLWPFLAVDLAKLAVAERLTRGGTRTSDEG